MSNSDLSVASMTKLARIANEAASNAEQYAADAVVQAIKCGEALNAAKRKCPHGEWIQWLEDNFDYSGRTARDFMKLANWQRAANLEDAKSIRQAMIAVSEAKLKSEPKRVEASHETQETQSDEHTIDAEFEVLEETIEQELAEDLPEVAKTAANQEAEKPKPTTKEQSSLLKSSIKQHNAAMMRLVDDLQSLMPNTKAHAAIHANFRQIHEAIEGWK